MSESPSSPAAAALPTEPQVTQLDRECAHNAKWAVSTDLADEYVARHRIQAVAAAVANKDREIERLKADLESHAWEISPAMAQARINQLNASLAAERALVSKLREALDRLIKSMKTYQIGRNSVEEAELALALQPSDFLPKEPPADQGNEGGRK